jgi:hypothetical protein
MAGQFVIGQRLPVPNLNSLTAIPKSKIENPKSKIAKPPVPGFEGDSRITGWERELKSKTCSILLEPIIGGGPFKTGFNVALKVSFISDI